ncbi:shikimate kinase [Candidatus Woesearchaeota archaeon]|nr:shikimate kinase [Candidatus Woesearchaeota archaeon]
MNIALIGYRGTGKTSIAEELGKMLGWQVIGTDAMVEKKAGKPVAAVVKEKGWDYFRKLEKRAVAEAAKMDKIIIDCGGGAVMDSENVEKLKKKGLFVLLKADADVIRQRLNKAGAAIRPPLKGKSPVAEVEEILRERMPVYERMANFVVDTSNSTVKDAAAEIVKHLNKFGVI